MGLAGLTTGVHDATLGSDGCLGDIKAKANAVFDIYDIDGQGSISQVSTVFVVLTLPLLSISQHHTVAIFNGN